MAQYMVTTDDGAASAVVFSVPNESGGSAMIFSFTACGQGAAPDRVVVDLVDSTLAFFAPLGN